MRLADLVGYLYMSCLEYVYDILGEHEEHKRAVRAAQSTSLASDVYV